MVGSGVYCGESCLGDALFSPVVTRLAAERRRLGVGTNRSNAGLRIYWLVSGLPQVGGLMQGSESECGWVGGIPLIENET